MIEKEIKDIIALPAAGFVNPYDDVSLKRIIMSQEGGIGTTTVGALEAAAAGKAGRVFLVLPLTWTRIMFCLKGLWTGLNHLLI